MERKAASRKGRLNAGRRAPKRQLTGRGFWPTLPPGLLPIFAPDLPLAVRATIRKPSSFLRFRTMVTRETLPIDGQQPTGSDAADQRKSPLGKLAGHADGCASASRSWEIAVTTCASAKGFVMTMLFAAR